LQFSRNLKEKIDKVSVYIDPSSYTLDYAILFVPNEMIFSYVNQKLPDVVDYAFKKHVLLVSPFTFLMVARTVLESYRNFMISDSLREAVLQVDEFVSEWGRFKEQFDKYGRTLKTLQGDYELLTGTRVRQMERKIEKIENYRQGTILKEAIESPLLIDPIEKVD
jgi:DNA recombination protein RmuC